VKYTTVVLGIFPCVGCKSSLVYPRCCYPCVTND